MFYTWGWPPSPPRPPSMWKKRWFLKTKVSPSSAAQYIWKAVHLLLLCRPFLLLAPFNGDTHSSHSLSFWRAQKMSSSFLFWWWSQHTTPPSPLNKNTNHCYDDGNDIRAPQKQLKNTATLDQVPTVLSDRAIILIHQSHQCLLILP